MESAQQDRPRAQYQRGRRYGNEYTRSSRRGNYRGRRSSRPRGSEASSRSTVLNCIVDESALLAGLATADGLKKWVRDGAINVFVPLYTLEKLNSLRSSPPPLNLNARKTLEWLDDITSATENKTSGHVELQGPDHQYQTWGEVEKYLLPETPLSSGNGPNNLDGMTDAFTSSLQIGNGQNLTDSTHEYDGLSPSSSNIYASPTTSPRMDEEGRSRTRGISHNRGNSHSSVISDYSVDWNAGFDNSYEGTSSIPGSVRPLLNYVVWRTYNESAPFTGTGRYILLTDEPATRKQAQKFGVRAKLLSQVRSIVSRAENREECHKYGDGAFSSAKARVDAPSMEPAPSVEQESQGDEEEVVFDPARRSGSSKDMSSNVNVWDPDHFGRSPIPPVEAEQLKSTVKDTSVHGKGRDSSGNAPYAAQGRGHPRNSRGRGPPSPRAQSGTTKRAARHTLEQPIDPDSYARPQPPSRRGRGGFRKLWDPNT